MEKDTLPGGKQLYSNISVVGFSQGAAAAVATLVKYNQTTPLGYIIAYAGWMEVNRANWEANQSV